MIFITRSALYQEYNWNNPLKHITDYIINRDIRNRDIFYWDGVEQLQIPFSGHYFSDTYKKYWPDFFELLVTRNINIFAVGGDINTHDELPQHPNLIIFRWKTALLHFIHHSMTTQYNNPNTNINPTFTKLFSCLNRHPRQERIMLVDSLYRDGLFEHGDVSWNTLVNEWEENPPINFKYWPEKRLRVDLFPKKIYTGYGPPVEELLPDGLVRKPGEDEYYIRDYQLLTDYVLNTNCLFNLACESVPLSHENTCFITEKTWKPILLGQPSIILGNYWYKKHMEDMGFKFYDNIIDYSFYGNANEYQHFPDLIPMLTKELSKFKNKNYQELYESIKDIVRHNRSRAYQILNNDPYISDEFVAFYNKHRNSWDDEECSELRVDIDIHRVFKNKIYT